LKPLSADVRRRREIFVMAASDELLQLCQRAIEMAPRDFPDDLPTTAGLAGAPAWYPFETRAWDLGERVRQMLVATPKLRQDSQVQDALLYVVECRNLRRGRQPFVTNLGYAAAAPLAARLVPYLRDRDIDGQVVGALIRMKVGGYSSEVALLVTARHAWVRNLAKKYIERFGAAPPN
jgi:hypothetical protein